MAKDRALVRRADSELERLRDWQRERALALREVAALRREVALERRRPRRQVVLEAAPVEVREPDRSGVWTGVAVGVGAAALVGVVGLIIYLLSRRRDGAPVAGLGESSMRYMPYPVPVYTPSPMVDGNRMYAAAPQAVVGEPRARRAPPGSYMKSYLLPDITDKRSQAVRVAQATDVPYEVVIRTIRPNDQWAVFSTTAAELDRPDISNMPLGDTIILPTGHVQTIHLKPRQVLYAKGSTNGVGISVTMTEFDIAGF